MENAWLRVQAADAAKRPLGDTRPFIFTPDLLTVRYGLVIFRDDQLEEA
jgi:hypothetical protein